MSTKPALEVAVRQEIEALHKFFVGWFQGILAKDSFHAGFLSRMSPDMILIPPAGSVLPLEALADSLRNGYGKNPHFRIAIRNVVVRRELPGHVLATYEEWQRGAQNSEKPDNARVASVLFATGERLTWLHIHETWMPPRETPAEAFNF